MRRCILAAGIILPLGFAQVHAYELLEGFNGSSQVILLSKVDLDRLKHADELEQWPKSFWASMQLIMAAMCGHFGIICCDQGIRQGIEEQHVKWKTKDYRTLLRLMPESVSRTIHQQTTPHGATFRCAMLLMALLIFASEYPRHELSYYGVSTWEITWQLCRCMVPVFGIIMLIYIPMSHKMVAMTEKFKWEDPDTQLTDDDKLVYLQSKFQSYMHNLAGGITFGLTPAYEGYAIGKCLYLFIAGDQTNEGSVRWSDGSRASIWYLALLASRSVVILGCDVCLFQMLYEYLLEPTTRWMRNPMFIYNSEKYLIQGLTNYVMLTGMSIWFVDLAAWNLMSDTAHIMLQLLAGSGIVASVLFTLWLFWYHLRIRRYLCHTEMRKLIETVLQRTERVMEASIPALEALKAQWALAGTVTETESDSDLDSP